MIVEDNEAERNSLKVALEAESFIVESVENASDVEKLVNLSEFDVALVDCELPDGLNLIEKMKLPAPELMFLVINANNSVNSSIEIFRAGAYNFMTKPWDIPALVKTINVMIKERNVAVSSKVKLVELQSKAGINYKYNDERISIITTPNPDMLINDKAKVNMQLNDRFIFHQIVKAEGPLGAMGLPLFAGRALAVDRSYIPLGSMMWLETTAPDGSQLNKIVMAEDVGAAIKGGVRGDYFWGHGETALEQAGRMNAQGRYYILIPKGAEVKTYAR